MSSTQSLLLGMVVGIVIYFLIVKPLIKKHLARKKRPVLGYHRRCETKYCYNLSEPPSLYCSGCDKRRGAEIPPNNAA